MSDHIPSEVVTVILERLSVKDLVTCRRVSKHWLAIIDSLNFIRTKLHSSMSTNSNGAVFLHPLSKKGDNNASNLLCWREEYGSGPIQYRSEDPDQVVLMGSCHGLICFTRVHIPHDLVILNPSTGERQVVSSFLNDEEFDELQAYGFGYDEISQGYKVVLITKPEVLECRVKIYDVKHKAFSTISIGWDVMKWTTYPNQQLVGVFLCGAIHWCVMDIVMFGCVILALDLASETMHRLPVPHNLHCQGKGYFKMNVGVVDSCFCICVVYKKEGKTDIWVMKEYWSGESWCKMYTIQGSNTPVSVIPLGGNVGGRILLLYGRSRFVWCDPGKNLVVEAFGAGGETTFEAIYSVESLIKLFQQPDDHDEEAKRKEHEAELVLRNQDAQSNNEFAFPELNLDLDLSIFEEILTASDEED